MSDNHQTRITLLQRLRDAHDERSWDEFVDIYRGYIYAIVRNMNMSWHDSEDIIQTVLVKAWEKLPSFEYEPGRGKFRSWLSTVTKNAVLNILAKKEVRRSAAEKHSAEEIAGVAAPSALNDLDALAEREWQVYIAGRALENVRQQFTGNVMAIFEAHSEGVSSADLAAQYDIAENTVHVYKMRVQKALFREINRLDGELS